MPFGEEMAESFGGMRNCIGRGDAHNIEAGRADLGEDQRLGFNRI